MCVQLFANLHFTLIFCTDTLFEVFAFHNYQFTPRKTVSNSSGKAKWCLVHQSKSLYQARHYIYRPSRVAQW